MKVAIVENPRPLTVEHCNDVANAPLSASLNSGYALAVAREAGWESCYLDHTRSDSGDAELAAAILATGAEVVLFHWVYSWGHEDRVAGIINGLKQEGNVLVGAFGLFPTLAGKTLCSYAAGIDFVLVGEFEESLKELLTGIERTAALGSLPGVLLPGQPFLPRDLIGEISQLPFPDDVGINAGLTSINIAASRGCFGNCSFCFIPSFYGTAKRRVRTVRSVEAELDLRLERRESSQVYFIDPTFLGTGSAEKQRVRGIGKVLKERRLRFGFECRVDTVDEALLQDLAADGATGIFLGVESGSEAALQRMNKRVGKGDMIRAVRAVQNAGIDLHVGFIMFEPDTMVQELWENYRFLDELGLLSDPDRTVNLLYHSQIVIFGSRSWERFDREGRLLRDKRLPFEACFTFRDPKVAKIYAGMKEVATEYFLSSARRHGEEGGASQSCRVPGGGEGSEVVNSYLKESFLRLLGGYG